MESIVEKNDKRTFLLKVIYQSENTEHPYEILYSIHFIENMA